MNHPKVATRASVFPGIWGLGALLIGCAPDNTVHSAPAAALQFGAVMLEVGVLDTPDAFVFGRISDVAAFGDGRFVVLDGHSMEIRLFDSEGNPLGRAGGHGEGPGELRSPIAMTVIEDSVVVVLDGGDRLARFRVGPSNLAPIGSLNLDIVGRDICALGDRLFVQGQHDGYAIHEVDESGHAIRSFHAVPEDVGFDLGPLWNPLLRDEAVSGSLACLEAPPVVAMVSMWLPDIYAYNSQGDRIWTSAVPNYRPVEPVLTPDGGQTWDRGEGSDYVVSLEPHPSGFLLVQSVHVAQSDDYLAASPTTYLLDPATGEINQIDSDLSIIRAMSRSLAFGVLTYPFPRVELVEVENPN